MQTLNSLHKLLQVVPDRLARLSEEQAESKPTPSSWSPKEELGHLLDSATNNHQRIVRTQFEDTPAMPGYDQNRWVEIHAYSRRNWAELIEIWQALNLQLYAAAEAVPNAAWSRTLVVAGSEPVTVQFIFEDYVLHMLHHLHHIGIETSDLASNATNAA
jgi:hypothetical protein